MDRGTSEAERRIVSKLTNQLSAVERVREKLLQEHRIISKEYEDRIKARRNPVVTICPNPNCNKEGRFIYADKKANKHMIRHAGHERHYLTNEQADRILKGLGRGKESLENTRLTPPKLAPILTPTPTPQKKGRDRPRKSDSGLTPQSQLELPKKRGRGGPRKYDLPLVPTPIKRGRGRPRKSESTSTLIPYVVSKEPQQQQLQAPIKRGRGRPRKTDSSLIQKQSQLETSIPVKRGRGRPRKEETQKLIESRLENGVMTAIQIGQVQNGYYGNTMWNLGGL